jgi:twitching motility protein PilT
MDILDMIRLAAEKGASDVHLVADEPLLLRINGLMEAVDSVPPLTAEEIDNCLNQVATAEQRAAFDRNYELDIGFGVRGVGRIRCNAAKQRASTSLVMRLLPSSIPSIEELGLPEICKHLVTRPRGMVIISGPTGSGKSMTLSAMINFLNSNHSRRVITIEDPIEFVYKNEKCTITQRELGSDTKSFAEALRHVLRQDPDVILVGEMRDQETATAALTIAETGHLILTTGHAPSASQAIERVIDMFPPYERPNVQSRLASLIPTADGSGRVPAVEVMLANAAIRSNIRDGKVFQLPNTILTNSRQGMILFDNALVNLYKSGTITRESVLAFCNDHDEIQKSIGTGVFV